MAVERRVVAVPSHLQGARLQRLRLPHPRAGALCSFYADAASETVLEVVRVDAGGQRSWLGDGWVEGSGAALLLTPVDPLFLFLRLLTDACQGSGDSEWRFVDIGSIGLEAGEGQDPESVRALLGLPNARRRALATLCETREVADTVVARVDRQRTVAWLCRKCSGDRLPEPLRAQLEEGLARTNEMALLVAEYLSPFWSALVADTLGLAAVRDAPSRPAQAPVYDAPDTYLPGGGIAAPKVEAKPKAKAPSAKERQLAEAAKKSKPITSFFAKRT
ncbi:hypothetical protein H4R18_002163 [Coemansia javaensis]|uniref:Uncharacterized protein n=1 Tax=Coemansia javaensis TaxID=2761396 RepID=A0A9W8HBN5_9FUNG|nr:hypothetical protein H4R18_002163 [Coemansia javaensis]